MVVLPRLVRSVVLIVTLLVVCLASLAQPHRSFAETRKADITVTIWPTPSIATTSGGTIAYRLRVKNTGNEKASYVRVSLSSYPPMQLSLVGASFESNNDWVSDIGGKLDQENVAVTFSGIFPNTTRATTLHIRVSPTVPEGTVARLWTSYVWEDSRGVHDKEMSNTAPVIIGNTEIDGPWIWMRMEPTTARAGSWHRVFSDRFHPGEEVAMWLNRQDGPPIPIVWSSDPAADEHGHVRFDFRTKGYPPGEYVLVVRGKRSDLIGLVAFTITPSLP